MRSDEIDKLAASLVAAQGQFSAVPKTSNNPFYSSKYAALPDVVAAVTPILQANGLAVSQFIDTVDGEDSLTTYLMHESGQYMSHSMRLHLVADKNGVVTPQAQGSAVTYARRYSLMAVLGIVADVDDDGNAASQSAPRPQQSAAPSLGNKVAAAANRPAAQGGDRLATEGMARKIWAITHKSLGWSDAQMVQFILDTVGAKVSKADQLNFDDAKAVIDALEAIQNGN